MEEEKDILFIERYFDEDLSESEKEIFTERLRGDENFKSLYTREKLLINNIRYRGMVEQLDALKTLEKRLSDNSASQTSGTRNWYYAIAASVALIMILSFWKFSGEAQSSEELFQAYFTPYQNLFEPTLRGDDMITKRKEAFQTYDRKEYENAIVLFEELLKEERDSGTLLLLSNAQMYVGKTSEAKENLQILISEYDALDIQATWYLSLCYVKEENMTEARKRLAELIEKETSYAGKAKELLEKIDR